MNRNFIRSDSLAARLEELAKKYNSERYLRTAYYYQGDFREEADSAELKHREERLLLAEKMATEANDTLLLAKICNSRGIWEMERRNYQTAQFFLKRGLMLARKCDDRNAANVLESNFSEVSRMLNDTLGLRYDRDIFLQAMRSGNYLRQRNAAIHCARYYLHPGGDTLALREYTDVIAPNDTTSGFVPMIYARYWLANNDYEKAYSFIIKSKYNEFYEAAITYAEILNRLGRYRESNKYVEDLFEMYKTKPYDNQWIGLYRLAASNFRGLGDNAKAYEYEHRYAGYSDSLNTQRLNDLTKRYAVEYGTEKLEFTVNAQREHVRWLRVLVGALIMIIAIVSIGLTLYFHKRNKFYRSIVSQYMKSGGNEHVQSLTAVNDIDHTPLSAPATETSPTGSNISAVKTEELWERIRHEMEDNRIWHDTNLSRDSLAALLGCSHTYLSETIRRKTGLSFSVYINSYRLNEAKRLLTDTGDTAELTLKDIASRSGFSSLSNFYTLFKQECGMPPAAFRKTARALADSGK